MDGLRLAVLAFVVGAATMILELAAPRLLAPQLGTTALVWIVTIGTFLGGLALGNVWGGRLADRHGAKVARGLFVAAGAAIVLALVLEPLAWSVLQGLPHAWRTILLIPFTFLPAAVVLGMLPPYIVRMALQHPRGRGATLGLLAASLAVGSVVGTGLAGFLLVPRLGTRTILLATAATLVLALVFVVPTALRPLRTAARARRARRIPTSALLLAGLAGAALLVLEVAVGRVGADKLGSSIYTWTAVIGVVLAGSALGAALGGRLADRFPPRALLASLLTIATLASLTLAWAPAIQERAHALAGQLELAWPTTVLLAVLLSAFFPSVAIGMLSPVIIRASLASPDQDGRIVGALYAAGTIGAVLATVLTGYWVLPAIGLEATLLVVPLLLLIARGVVRRRTPWVLAALWLALALVVLAPPARTRGVVEAVGLSVEDDAVILDDSRYARIRVSPVTRRWIALQVPPDELGMHADYVVEDRATWDPGRLALTWTGPMSIREQARLRTHMESEADRLAIDRLRRLSKQDVRALWLDRLIHSYVNLQDPTFLGYDYERVYDAVLRRFRKPEAPLRALFLGGGGYAFQRRLLATREGPLEIVTVEIDPAVTEIAQAHLGLEADGRHRIHHEDARTYVATRGANATPFDVVFGDAFDDLAVPFHLTTSEFVETVARSLGPNGIYMVNVIDTFDSGLFLGAFTETLGRVFQHVRVLTAPPRADDVRNTFVLLASNAELALEDLEDENGLPMRLIVYPREEIEALEERTGHRVLRDDHAPVEILLAPVVEARQ